MIKLVLTIIGRFPAGRVIRSYYTGISHGPVSAPTANANWHQFISTEVL